MQSLGTGSVGDNLLGSFWIVCGEVTIIVPASLLSPCPRCAETLQIVAKQGACGGTNQAKLPQVVDMCGDWTILCRVRITLGN